MSGELAPSKAKSVWPCPLCPEIFHWRRHLDKHVEGHRNNACRLCDFAVTTQKELFAHMLQQHQVVLRDDKHACKYCERCFPRRHALFLHYQSSHAEGKIVCLDCGLFLDSEPELELHSATHDKDRPWKCQRCPASFSRRQQYTLHVEAHNRYRCDVCNFNFTTKLALAEHGRDNHGLSTARHKCTHCEACFERPCQLRRHQESHADKSGAGRCGQKGGECCGRVFPSARSLNKHRASIRHLEAVTPDSRKKLECAKCGRRFARKASLARHVRPPRSFACDACDFVSARFASLHRHRALHTAPRAFVCDRCGVAFAAMTALNEHVAHRHSDERLFVCAVCPLTFKTNSALKRHAQTHSDSRPHVCACGQRYKRASHLRRHQTAAHGPAPPVRSRKVERIPQPAPPPVVAPVIAVAIAVPVVGGGGGGGGGGAGETNQVFFAPHQDHAVHEISRCWPATSLGELGGQLSLQANDSLRVHQEIVSLNRAHGDISLSSVGISSQTMLQSLGNVLQDMDLVHQSIGSSYKDMVEQALRTSCQTLEISHQTTIVHQEMEAPHKTISAPIRAVEIAHSNLLAQGMVEQAMEMEHQDLLQQAMELAHCDMVRRGIETPRGGLGTPEQMLQDGYDFGATGLEFTTLQTVHKARDLSLLTDEDMTFSADTFLL